MTEVPDRGERIEQGDEAERRIARARSAIGKSFEELIARGERAGPRTGGGPPGPAAPAPPDIEASAAKASVGGAADEATRQRIDDAIEARVLAVEATLRSRLAAAVDEGAAEQDRRLREESADHRRRINEELAVGLRSTADELRRQIEAEREGARRELSAAADMEIAAATQRLAELRSTAARDAREAAEAVAASRLADARGGLSEDVRRAREETRAEIERSMSGLDARIRGIADALRDEQGAAAATRDDEIRRRVDARVAELGGELAQRIEREIARGLADVRAALELTSAEAAERVVAEAREGAETAIAREVAKGEAQVVAAVESARDGIERAAGEAARAAVVREADGIGEDLQRAMAVSAGEQMQAIREETARSSYREHDRRAEAAATAQLARSLDALKKQRAELGAELDASARVECERHAGEAVAEELERRGAELERRIDELTVAAEQRAAVHLTAAVAAAGKRLAAVEQAQQREERIRERTAAAEREAAERVREAERRLVDVLGRIEATERRGG